MSVRIIDRGLLALVARVQEQRGDSNPTKTCGDLLRERLTEIRMEKLQRALAGAPGPAPEPQRPRLAE